MRRQVVCAVVTSTAALLLGSSAWAAGAAVNETGARGTGMANAVTAIADRVQALPHNPAGIAQLTGLNIDASVAMILPRFGFDTNVPATGEPIRVNAQDGAKWVPSAFVSYRAHERVAVGFGVHAPFGLGIAWSDTLSDGTSWWGRSQIQEIDITTIYMRPTVAVNLSDRILLGASLLLVQSAIDMKRAVTSSNDPADDTQLTMSGSDFGVGGAAGVLVKVIPGFFNVGLAYRSAVGVTYEGDAVFTKDGSGDGIAPGLRQELTDGPARAEFTFPHKLFLGLALFPTRRWKVSTNFEFITWSSTKDLTIEFPDNPQLTTFQAKEWSNVFKFSLGGEYLVLEDNLPVRVGFIYDPSPIPNHTVGPELPDTDRFLFSFGVGYTWKGFTVDLAYEFLFGPSNDNAESAPISGSRSLHVNILGMSLGYNLDI